MQFYSRRSLKTLLFESIVGQTYFLEEIYKIAKSNEEKGIVLGKITSAICNAVDSDDIGFKAARDLSGKQAKQARNAINTKIHKEIAKLNGYGNSPFNLKGIKHFYDSILKYAKEKSDVSIDECLLAADYFMKEFYPVCKPEIKELVDTGEYPLDKVFVKTEYFTRFVNNETGLGILRDYSCYEIYEDENVSVVYPKSPLSFVNYIVSQGISINNISWCTRTPVTWYSYNKDQYVMILRDKRSKSTDDSNYIISLKVNFDGTIDYKETCNRFNNHMNERSVRNVLDENAHRQIASQINIIDVNYDVESEDVISNVKSLADVNKLKELSELLSACLVIIKDIDDLKNIFLAAKESLDIRKFIDIVLESTIRLYFDTFSLENEEEENDTGQNVYEDRFFVVAEAIEADGEDAVKIFMSKLYDLAKKNGHPRYVSALLSFNYFNEYTVEDFIEDQNINIRDVCDLFEKSCRNKSPHSFKVLIDSFSSVLEKAEIRDNEGNLVTEIEEVPYEFFDILSSSNCFREYIKTFKLNIATNYLLQMPKHLSYLSEENPIISAIVGIKEESIRDQIKQSSAGNELQNIDLTMLATAIERRLPSQNISGHSLEEIGKLVAQDMSVSFGTLTNIVDENILVNIFKSNEYLEKIILALQSNKRTKFCSSLAKFLVYSVNDPGLSSVSRNDFVKKFNFLLSKCVENSDDFSNVVNSFDSIHRLISFVTSLNVGLNISVNEIDNDFVDELNIYLYKSDTQSFSTLNNIISSSLNNSSADRTFKIKLETCIQLASDEKDVMGLAITLFRVLGNKSRNSPVDKPKVVEKALQALKSKNEFEKTLDYVLNYNIDQIVKGLTYLDVFNMITSISEIGGIRSSSIINVYREYTKDSLKAPVSTEEIICLSKILSLISDDVTNYSGTIQKIINRISFNSNAIDKKHLAHVLKPLEIVLQNANSESISLSGNVLSNLLNVVFKEEMTMCVSDIMTNMIANSRDKNSLDISIGRINPVNHVSSGTLNPSNTSIIEHYLKCAIEVIKQFLSNPDEHVNKLKSDFERLKSQKSNSQFDEDDPFAGIDFSDFGDFDLYEYLKLKVSSVI